MSPHRASAWIAVAALVTGYLLLANDGRHHWHEFREIHSARFYSNSELMRGAFDPGPSPLRTPDEVATWYVNKLLQIEILRLLIDLFGVGLTALETIQLVYAVLLPVTGALTVVALCKIGLPVWRAGLIAAAMLLSPLGIYLGFKSLGDVPALMFAAAAAASLTAGLRSSVWFWPLSVSAGVCLALSAMASWTGPPLVLGLYGALLVTPPHGLRRRTILTASLVGVLTSALCLTGGLVLLGGSIDGYWRGLVALMGFSKALPMWLFAVFSVGLFGGALWIIAPLSWMSHDAQLRRIFLVWLGAAILVPGMLGSGFLEPRYLVGALVPLAGLAVMGVEAAWDRASRSGYSLKARSAWATIVALTVVGSAAAVQPIMPYELDQPQLTRLVREQAATASVAILTPWNYSDFHFLRFAYPDRAIYLVQSAATEVGDLVDDAHWTSRFAEMYGDRYLPSAAAVSDSLAEGGLLYVGWTVLPSFQNLKAVLLAVRLPRVAAYVDASQFRNHMAESWLVSDPHFTMREFARYGQYRVSHVTRRHRWALTEETPSKPKTTMQEVPLWGIFETTLLNDRSYTNPFTDTELDAMFLSPSGKAHRFFGFFDGDGNGSQNGTTWKLRFMCLEPGIWQWSAAFTEGATGASGSFRCAKGSLPGPLRINEENPHWLRRADGRPFLPRWYYLHELLFSKEGVWQRDVDNLLVGKGYNMAAVLTTQAEHLVANGWNRRQYERPFFYPWKRDGSVVDWSAMDLASWQKLDRVLRYLQDRGVYVYFFDGLFPNIAPRFPDDPLLENAYIRYALARAGVYWNVTHNVAFEFSEFMPISRLKRIGRYIKAIDPFKLLLTVHDTQDFGGLVQDEQWLDVANLQYHGGTAGDAGISNALVAGNSFGKPVAATEMVWEGADKLTAEQVRRGAWGILLAGGFFLYGEFNLGGIGVGDFGLGKAQRSVSVMLDVMESIPYWTMMPRNDLVDSGDYCLASPGTEYVVYSESSEPVSLDLSDARGTLSVEWIKPDTGERFPVGAVTGGSRRTFTSPTETLTGDWVLLVRRLSRLHGQ